MQETSGEPPESNFFPARDLHIPILLLDTDMTVELDRSVSLGVSSKESRHEGSRIAVQVQAKQIVGQAACYWSRPRYDKVPPRITRREVRARAHTRRFCAAVRRARPPHSQVIYIGQIAVKQKASLHFIPTADRTQTLEGGQICQSTTREESQHHGHGRGRDRNAMTQERSWRRRSDGRRRCCTTSRNF